MENCPKESRNNRNPQSTTRERSAAPPPTRDRGRGRGGQSQHKGRGRTVSEMVDHPMPSAPTRAYAMKAREDQDAPKVIAGIFSLYDIEMHVLIDPGSPFICMH